MTDAIKQTLRESKAARWGALFVLSFAMFAGYWFTEVISPIKPLLEATYGWSSSDFGTVVSAYGWFNVFLGMLVIVGIVLDKMGIRFSTVAATLTINLTFGSGLVAPGTGIVLNDEMDDFAAAPGQPNAFGLVGAEANSIAPGKRPLSSMTPTIVLQDGRVRMVTGAPGGAKIITTTLQTIVNVVDFGMNALQAVAAPRIHHQWYPPLLYYEHFGLSPDTLAKLQGQGYVLEERSPMCNAQVIVVDPETGVRSGASDPRGMGTAAGF